MYVDWLKKKGLRSIQNALLISFYEWCFERIGEPNVRKTERKRGWGGDARGEMEVKKRRGKEKAPRSRHLPSLLPRVISPFILWATIALHGSDPQGRLFLAHLPSFYSLFFCLSFFFAHHYPSLSLFLSLLLLCRFYEFFFFLPPRETFSSGLP